MLDNLMAIGTDTPFRIILEKVFQSLYHDMLSLILMGMLNLGSSSCIAVSIGAPTTARKVTVPSKSDLAHFRAKAVFTMGKLRVGLHP